MLSSDSIRLAVRTGSTRFGYDENFKLLSRGRVKLVLVSKNLDQKRMARMVEMAKLSEIPLVKLDYTAVELGSLCDLRHPTSVVGIRDPGTSNILQLVGNEQQNKDASHE